MLVCACCSLAVGVRMARTGFQCVDIYLYTDGVARDCGAFSCSCGRAGVGWRCLCMDVSRFVSCGVLVWLYLCIYICTCGGGLLVCIDRYI